MQCHWLLGGRPRDRLTWQLSAYCLVSRDVIWQPGHVAEESIKATADAMMVSEMDGTPVVAAIASLRTKLMP